MKWLKHLTWIVAIGVMCLLAYQYINKGEDYGKESFMKIDIPSAYADENSPEIQWWLGSDYGEGIPFRRSIKVLLNDNIVFSGEVTVPLAIPPVRLEGETRLRNGIYKIKVIDLKNKKQVETSIDSSNIANIKISLTPFEVYAYSKDDLYMLKVTPVITNAPSK